MTVRWFERVQEPVGTSSTWSNTKDGPYRVYADGRDKCTKASDSRGRAVFVSIVEEAPSPFGGRLDAPIPLEATEG